MIGLEFDEGEGTLLVSIFQFNSAEDAVFEKEEIIGAGCIETGETVARWWRGNLVIMTKGQRFQRIEKLLLKDILHLKFIIERFSLLCQ